MKLKSHLIALLLSGLFLLVSILAISQDVLSHQELLKLESMSGLQVNPVKDELIFSVSTPRGPNDAPGGSNTEYFRTTLLDRIPIPLFMGKIKGRSPQYSYDGEHIGFLYAKTGEPEKQQPPYGLV